MLKIDSTIIIIAVLCIIIIIDSITYMCEYIEMYGDVL